MKKYNIKKDKVIHHYDANGKICPVFWCGSSAKDKLWKEQFLNKLESNSENKEESKVEKMINLRLNIAYLHAVSGYQL